MRIVQRLSDQSSSKSCSSQSSISSDPCTQSDFFPDGENYFSLAPSHPVSENVLANAKGGCGNSATEQFPWPASDKGNFTETENLFETLVGFVK